MLTRSSAPAAAGSLALLVSGAVTAPALAQEAMYTAAATMPSPGTVLVREQFHWYRYDDNPADGSNRTDRYEFLSTLYIGIIRDLSLNVDLPFDVVDRRFPAPGTDDLDSAITRVDFTFKYRFFREDTGGIDTRRAALLFGTALSTDDDDDGIVANPHLGAVYTEVFGRHGVNFEIRYTLNTGGDPADNFGGQGPDDALAYNAAYLYRFFPDAYTSDSTGAWYATLELNGLYETGGDSELRFSPGIMFEGRVFGFEIMGQLPVYQDLDDRPDLEFAVGVGFRLLF
ncbi:MAG: hypothetical protein AB7K52_01720 [Phycisphaerales bacterium]